MKPLYNLLTYLLLVPYAVYWLLRALLNRSYRHKLPQRFGYGFPELRGSLWVHAVSVGEVVAATPLIKELLRAYPDDPVLVTTVTPTGAARVETLFADRVTHAYIPFETPDAINRFFGRVRPRIALIMETEIWPNLYQGCGVRQIPLVLVSARISPRSVDSYRKLLPLFRETLSHGIVIAAQSEADADRFVSLGASPDRTRVTGNIKFDVEIPGDLPARGSAFRESVLGRRPVWIAASTHDGEETKVLDAHRELSERFPDLLLILVPRHPQRFDSVRDLLERRGETWVSRTSGIACDAATRVYFGDTMGEVTLFYAASDIAFVAGSLMPIGGHNLLEPASLGVPILTGPHVFNAQEIADRFIEQRACRVVHDAGELASAVADWLDDPAAARRAGDAGRAILEDNRGALERLLTLVRPLLDAH